MKVLSQKDFILKIHCFSPVFISGKAASILTWMQSRTELKKAMKPNTRDIFSIICVRTIIFYFYLSSALGRSDLQPAPVARDRGRQTGRGGHLGGRRARGRHRRIGGAGRRRRGGGGEARRAANGGGAAAPYRGAGHQLGHAHGGEQAEAQGTVSLKNFPVHYWGSVTFWSRSGSADTYVPLTNGSGSGSNSGSDSFLH
jgi:hypothetical protein